MRKISPFKSVLIVLVMIVLLVYSCSIVYIKNSKNVDVRSEGSSKIDTLNVLPIKK